MKELYTKPETMINEFKTADTVLTASTTGIEEVVKPGIDD